MYPKLYVDYFRRFERSPEVFVAMSFQHAFNDRWRNIFKPAIASIGLRAVRADRRLISDSIPVEIVDAISRARFVLADLSSDSFKGISRGPNPNVMYELGLAHALRLPEEVITVRDASDAENAPFDIRHIRYIEYQPTRTTASVRLIKRLLRSAERGVDLTRDRLVDRAIASLDLDSLAFLETVQSEKTFDLYLFDTDRKGLYCLGDRDSSEPELRALGRRLISLGLLEPGNPGPRERRVYGGVPEYVVTPFGCAVIQKLRRERWNVR